MFWSAPLSVLTSAFNIFFWIIQSIPISPLSVASEYEEGHRGEATRLYKRGHLRENQCNPTLSRPAHWDQIYRTWILSNPVHYLYSSLSCSPLQKPYPSKLYIYQNQIQRYLHYSIPCIDQFLHHFDYFRFLPYL